ncbi:hypothetical protein [Providencia sp. Me31A]|uniref:hypothetical protein n=1 Tax=Providencia sp. Me31A TaxID=3392637 RepID=UPI003D2A8EE1
MKKRFIISMMAIFLFGCDDKNNQLSELSISQTAQFNGVKQSNLIKFNGDKNSKISDFNGDYTCEISLSMNHLAILNRNKNVFPSVVTHARLMVKDGVMTIYGMQHGDYISHKMTVSAPYIDEAGRIFKSEVQLEYKNDYMKEDFSKKYGIAMISERYLVGKRFMQQFTNCKLTYNELHH